MSKRSVKYGGMSVAVTVVFLVGTVLLNVLVSMLVERFYWKIDLTDTGLFEISGDTANVLYTMDEPVTLTVLAEEAEYQSREGLQVIREILQKYVALSGGMITVRYLDPNLHPTLAEQYKTLELSYFDIIVESDRRYTSIGYLELFQTGYDYDTGQQTITGVQAEQKLTNAVVHVLNETVTKAVIVTGHDEYRFTVLETLLNDLNYTVEEVDLTTSPIPEDATIAILSPTGDFTEGDIARLDEFLSAGGNVLWVHNEEGRDLGSLKRYFEEWGISFGQSVILEPEMSDPLYPFIIYPEVSEHDATVAVDLTGSMKVMSPFSSPITRLFDSRDGRTTHALLTSTDRSYARSNDSLEETYDRLDEDAPGPFDVAVLSTQTSYDEQGEPVNNSVLAVSAYMVSAIGSSNLNAAFLTSVLSYMSPSAESIYIAPKSLMSGTMQVRSGHGIALLCVLLAIPLLILAAGIVVWRRRRNL